MAQESVFHIVTGLLENTQLRNYQMEGMHRAKYGGREHMELLCPLKAPAHLAPPHGHQPRCSPNPSFRVLWRLHYIGMIEYVIGH